MGEHTRDVCDNCSIVPFSAITYLLAMDWVNLYVLIFCLFSVCAEKDWKKKDPRDYSDVDLERLLEQWDEDEEPLPVDELPEWDPRKPQPEIKMEDMQTQNPEDLLRLSKKGKTVMAFVKVSGGPTKAETEEITSIWQTGLWNSHIHLDRFPVDEDRVIFMFKDGSSAWEAKDFLIEQERCLEVQIEQRVYHGKHTELYKVEQAEMAAKKKAATSSGQKKTKKAKKSKKK